MDNLKTEKGNLVLNLNKNQDAFVDSITKLPDPKIIVFPKATPSQPIAKGARGLFCQTQHLEVLHD